MSGRISSVLREYVLGLSILIIIPSIFFIFMGIVYYVTDIAKSATSPIHFIQDPVGVWNAYILVAGLIIFGIGVYYLYNYNKKRNFLLSEMKTDKRSEILKKRNKLQSTVKHLPKKYQRMLRDKEDELSIK